MVPNETNINISHAGLCADCINARLITSDKASVFIQCRLSATDARFTKYPRLPVVTCEGYMSKTQIAPRIIDITHPLDATIAVWPGDTPFQTLWTSRIDRGDFANVGGVSMSLHAGTHADAPLHVCDGGASIDAMLEPFIGPALVVEVDNPPAITLADVKNLPAQIPPRIVFKVGVAGYVDANAARELVARGIRLVGVDSSSIDSEDSATLETHHVLADTGIVILENLDLSEVAPGIYELIALPLRLAGMEASPVRAILRSLD